MKIQNIWQTLLQMIGSHMEKPLYLNIRVNIQYESKKKLIQYKHFVSTLRERLTMLCLLLKTLISKAPMVIDKLGKPI